jgi:hypothetical protein
MDGDPKYKMFRNFMVNELGITRDDLATWTKEAITAQVVRLLGQMNLQQTVENAVKTELRSYNGMIGDIKRNIVENISKSIELKIKE